MLWTAGVEAPPLAAAVAKATGAQQDRAGRLLCGKDLSLPGHPDILVTGDMMSLDKLPGVAEVAMQTGLYAGRRISHEAQGQTYDKPFRYHDLGSAAYISRGRAVVSAFKMHFGGFPGWVVWLFIHIGFLTGFRNRIGALFSWWFAFTRDLRRERTFTIDDMPVGAYSSRADPAASIPRRRPVPKHQRSRTDRRPVQLGYVGGDDDGQPAAPSRGRPPGRLTAQLLIQSAELGLGHLPGRARGRAPSAPVISFSFPWPPGPPFGCQHHPSRQAMRLSMWSPTRRALAMAVSAGFTAPMLGKKLVSTT